jgi:hypothetical protein
MNKLSHYFLSILLLLLGILGVQMLYMYNFSSLHVEEKNIFVKVVGLPDLSISNSANFIRHRSLSDTFSLFSNGPELLEYFPSTFTYNYSSNQKNSPSRIELAK